MVCFASGSSRVSDIRGFSAIGQAIGVTAPEVSPAAEAAIIATAGTGLPVFVDSGAFSEVEFGADGPRVVKPITSDGWSDRLGLYLRIGTELGSDAYVVAPDRIGDQSKTISLLIEWKTELEAIASTGANILVPVQKGGLDQSLFFEACKRVLGFPVIPALPMKKNATTFDEAREFVTATKPERIHLLGLGENNRQRSRIAGMIEQESPGCLVTMDACKIAASIGRTNGPGGAPRALTRAKDIAVALIDGGLVSGYSTQELGIILAFGNPHHIKKSLKV